ncbi:hypothetical protein E2C01_071076 [Portunus trituberculatus]|uniref:Uncharacterized protein n=1 Tax=Portunus trituberculatus TaxID=210409 RepID=A0A5B7I328_PORTR|nr:hypothetical protein [Portunus trituberculatus]
MCQVKFSGDILRFFYLPPLIRPLHPTPPPPSQPPDLYLPSNRPHFYHIVATFHVRHHRRSLCEIPLLSPPRPHLVTSTHTCIPKLILFTSSHSPRLQSTRGSLRLIISLFSSLQLTHCILISIHSPLNFIINLFYSHQLAHRIHNPPSLHYTSRSSTRPP